MYFLPIWIVDIVDLVFYLFGPSIYFLPIWIVDIVDLVFYLFGSSMYFLPIWIVDLLFNDLDRRCGVLPIWIVDVVFYRFGSHIGSKSVKKEHPERIKFSAHAAYSLV